MTEDISQFSHEQISMKNAASAELQGILQPTQQAEIPQELGDSARVGRF